MGCGVLFPRNYECKSDSEEELEQQGGVDQVGGDFQLAKKWAAVVAQLWSSPALHDHEVMGSNLSNFSVIRPGRCRSNITDFP